MKIVIESVEGLSDDIKRGRRLTYTLRRVGGIMS